MELTESFANSSSSEYSSLVTYGISGNHHNVVMVEACCVGDAFCACAFHHNLIAPIVPHCWANVPAWQGMTMLDFGGMVGG
eukprot:15348040-Ditylum_brightwellii.AAC.1